MALNNNKISTREYYLINVIKMYFILLCKISSIDVQYYNVNVKIGARTALHTGDWRQDDIAVCGLKVLRELINLLKYLHYLFIIRAAEVRSWLKPHVETAAT